MAVEDFLRSHPFAFKKDSTLGPASIAAATSLAAHGAERGEGCAIIILPTLSIEPADGARRIAINIAKLPDLLGKV